MKSPRAGVAMGGRVDSDGLGGALVARVVRARDAYPPANGRSWVIVRDCGREGGLPVNVVAPVGPLNAVRVTTSGRALVHVPIAGSFRG